MDSRTKPIIMSVKSVVRSTGQKVVNDNTKKVFVQGAYNLGAILENKTILTTAVHPGETVMHAAGAAGEDTVIIMADKNEQPVGILEIDFGQVKDCSVDYAAGDEAPVIFYHWNPGALCRNIQCTDPGSSILDAGSLLHTHSGTAGSLKVLVEVALIDSDTSDGEAFNTAAVLGDQAAYIAFRTPMRAKYFHADPSAPYTCVAYILNT